MTSDERRCLPSSPAVFCAASQAISLVSRVLRERVGAPAHALSAGVGVSPAPAHLHFK
jgi:hypothetical protein